MFDVCYWARFQADPRRPRMIAVKHIFRYLCKTVSLGIWYPSNTGFFKHWILHTCLLWLRPWWLQSRTKKYFRRLSISWWQISKLVVQETNLCFHFHCGSWIHWSSCLYVTNYMDTKSITWLWNQHEKDSTLLWFRKCYTNLP